MKPDIHPEYHEVKVTCSCGHRFAVRSTYPETRLTVEVCSECHPFYTGKHKIMESAGQVDKFRKRYGKQDKAAPKQNPAQDKAPPPETPKPATSEPAENA